MSVKDLQIHWHNYDAAMASVVRALNERGRSISAAFLRALPESNPGSSRKVFVGCVPSDPRRPLVTPRVCEVEVVFSLSGLTLGQFGAQVDGQIADAVAEGLSLAAEETGWSRETVLVARDKVEEAGYADRWTWPRRPVKAPAGMNATAQLSMVHSPESFTATLVIRGPGKRVLEKSFLTTKPVEFTFVPLLGSLRWDHGWVELVSKDGAVVARASAD